MRPPCSQYLEHLRHRDGGERGLAELAVADRERQHGWLGLERAGFVDERQARCVRQPRQVARRGGQPDADETDVVVAERAGGRDGHHLGGRVSRAGHAGLGAAAARARSVNISGRAVHHVLLDPPLKAVAISRDGVPRDVERVVARVVAVRVGWMRAARHGDDGVDGPGRQDDRVRAEALEAIDDLLDGDDRRPGGQDRLLLHADDALDEHVAGAVGLLCVDDRDVGPMRGDRRQRSPVNGQVMNLMFGFTFARSEPR